MKRGGAIYGDGVRGAFVNVRFADNLSVGPGGAVILTRMLGSDTHLLANCVFYSGHSSGGAVPIGAGLHLGGGYTTGSAYAQIVNCTFADNDNTTNPPLPGQALTVEAGSSATVDNSILWENNYSATQQSPISGPVTASYSDVQGGWSGFTNKNQDPLFVNLAGGDVSLQATALNPCIDAANYNALPADILDVDGNGNTLEVLPWDIAWQGRTFDLPSVGNSGAGTYIYLDIGAYERH